MEYLGLLGRVLINRHLLNNINFITYIYLGDSKFEGSIHNIYFTPTLLPPLTVLEVLLSLSGDLLLFSWGALSFSFSSCFLGCLYVCC